MPKTRILFNRQELRSTRKFLRNNSTSAEIAFWNIIKNKKLDGRKFRRQYGIGPYIVDFCCTSEKLIIELDGEFHGGTQQIIRDAQREEYIIKQGFRIIRFENRFVFQEPDYVISEIRKLFRPSDI